MRWPTRVRTSCKTRSRLRASSKHAACAREEIERSLGKADEQEPAMRRDGTAREVGFDAPWPGAVRGWTGERGRNTLCRHEERLCLLCCWSYNNSLQRFPHGVNKSVCTILVNGSVLGVSEAMTKPPDEGLLELDVTDFGPIVEAKIDLRPLTVFVGPSNTGKSYLAILIYALHRVFGGDTRFAGRRFRRGFRFPLRRDSQDLSQASVDALLEVADSMSADVEERGQRSLALPHAVADALRLALDELADALSNEIGRCFGVGESHALIRRGRTNTSRVVLRRRISDGEDSAQHTVSLARKPQFTTTVPAEVQIPVDFEAGEGMGRFLHRQIRYLDEEKRDMSRRKFAAMEFLSFIGDMALPSLVGPLHLPAYYLPADRTGVMHAHSVVVSALIASAPTAGLRPAARTPMLSGVLADFLEQLIEIDQTGRARRKTERDIGRSIEEAILGGSVRIDRSTHIDYPRFAYRPHGWKDDLALANASSMVSELAPVVLYLRHMVESGNVLIVEEPESHLHPAMQVAFTRELAALVNAGIRVIVTTHSEWLLEELANIVRRSKLSKAEHGDKVALRPDQVGAWLFEPKQRPKGSVVKEIRLDESGLYPSDYYEVASALHNEWADISSRIGDDS